MIGIEVRERSGARFLAPRKLKYERINSNEVNRDRRPAVKVVK